MRYLLVLVLPLLLWTGGLKAQSTPDFIGVTACETDTLFLIDASTSTGNLLEFRWDLDNDAAFDDDSVQNVALTNWAPGVYQIGLQVISDLPDTTFIYLPVEIAANPIADLSSNLSLYCIKDTVFLTLNTTANTGLGAFYMWEDNTGNAFSRGQDTFLIYENPGAVTMKLMVNNPATIEGCKDSAFVFFNIKQSVSSFSLSVPFACVGQEVKLKNTSDACGTIQEIAWDLDNDGAFDDGTGDSIMFQASTEGSFLFRMRLTTDKDTTIAQNTLNIDPRPLASFTINNKRQVEPINQFAFTNTSSLPVGGLLYTWDFGDGSSGTDENPVHTYGSSDTFTVRLFAMSSLPSHCIDTAYDEVIVYPTEPSLASDNVCFGFPSVFRNTSISSEVVGSIEWELDGDGMFNEGSGDNFEYVFSRFGNHAVSMRLSTPDQVYIVHGTATVLPKVFGDFTTTEVCEGNATVFRPLIPTTPGVGSVTASWDFDNDNTIDSTGVAGNNPLSFTYAGAGIFQPVLYLSTAAGCTDTVNGTASVISAPRPSFTAGNACLGQSIRFTNTSLSGNDPISLYLWTMGDGNSRTDTGSFNYTYAQAGAYEVSLYLQSEKGCNATFKTNAEVFDLPLPTIEIFDLGGASSAPELYQGDSLELRLTSSFNSLNWTPSGSSNTSIRVGSAGTYGVFATDINGCTAYDEIRINELARPDLIIRNVITPNGDGINDELFAENLRFHVPLRITVYHSSGAELFNSENYQNDWKPEFNQKSLSEGLYFYYAEDGNGKIYQGTLSIVK